MLLDDSTPEPPDSDSDFKLIKKYARKCNLQNKYLQSMLSVVIDELNKSVSTLDIDLNCLSEANVESFFTYWSAYTETRYSSVEVEEKLKDRVERSEQACAEYEDATTQAAVKAESNGAEIITAKESYKNLTETDGSTIDGPITDAACDDTPVKSVRLSLDKGLLLTTTGDRLNEANASESGRGSRCQSREGRNSTGSVLLDDIMLACEAEEARAPPPEIKGKGFESSDTAVDTSSVLQPEPIRFDSTEISAAGQQTPVSTKSKDSVNPFDDDELDRFEQSKGGVSGAGAPSEEMEANANDTKSVHNRETDVRRSDIESSQSCPRHSSRAAPTSLAEATNPFDSDDDGEEGPAAPVSSRIGEGEDFGDNEEVSKKPDPYSSTEVR